MDIVVTSVLYGEEYLIEDISGLDCFSDIEDDVWRVVVSIDGEDIEGVIDDINLLVIFTGISDIVSCVVMDVVIIVDTSNVVFAVDM